MIARRVRSSPSRTTAAGSRITTPRTRSGCACPTVDRAATTAGCWCSELGPTAGAYAEPAMIPTVITQPTAQRTAGSAHAALPADARTCHGPGGCGAGLEVSVHPGRVAVVLLPVPV
jgi:hypothetical protein